jgi:hypothetical protein
MGRDLSKPKWELYNIINDISETDDRAEDNPDQVADMAATIWSRMDSEMLVRGF